MSTESAEDESPNKFCFIGYGIDCHGKFRDLPHLCQINQIGLKYVQEDQGVPITPVKKGNLKAASAISNTPCYVTKNLLTISAVTESSLQYSGEKSDQINTKMDKSLTMEDEVRSPKCTPQSFSI